MPILVMMVILGAPQCLLFFLGSGSLGYGVFLIFALAPLLEVVAVVSTVELCSGVLGLTKLGISKGSSEPLCSWLERLGLLLAARLLVFWEQDLLRQ